MVILAPALRFPLILLTLNGRGCYQCGHVIMVCAFAGNAEAAPAVSMTVETVDRALEEVRPYLIADGGNVTVLDVVDGTVMLQLDVRNGSLWSYRMCCRL